MNSGFQRYLEETLGVFTVLIPEPDTQPSQRHVTHTEMSVERYKDYKVLVIAEIKEPKHRILLERILAASGVKLEYALIADSQFAHRLLSQRSFHQTLVLGDFVEFHDQKEGEQRVRQGFGLTLKTFSLFQLEMSVETKKLAWASLQLWMRQLNLKDESQ